MKTDISSFGFLEEEEGFEECDFRGICDFIYEYGDFYGIVTVYPDIRNKLQWSYSHENPRKNRVLYSTVEGDFDELPEPFKTTVTKALGEREKQYQEHFSKTGIKCEHLQFVHDHMYFDSFKEDGHFYRFYFRDQDRKAHCICIPTFKGQEIHWNFYVPEMRGFLTHEKDSVFETGDWFKELYWQMEEIYLREESA